MVALGFFEEAVWVSLEITVESCLFNIVLKYGNGLLCRGYTRRATQLDTHLDLQACASQAALLGSQPQRSRRFRLVLLPLLFVTFFNALINGVLAFFEFCHNLLLFANIQFDQVCDDLDELFFCEVWRQVLVGFFERSFILLDF